MFDAVTGLVEDQTQSVPAQVNTDSVNQPSGDVVKNISSDYSERKSSGHLRVKHGDKKRSKLQKYILWLLGSSDRALRSRDNKPKPPEPINNVAETIERKKKKTRNEGINAQFSRIRAQLRYYLNRISYEQSLIDAYCGQGL